MRSLLRLIIWLTVVALLPLSCKKEDSGQSVLPPTAASLLSGDGMPLFSIGNEGDFYLDTALQWLYGPKHGGAWGEGVSLKGSAGVRTDTFRVTSPEWQTGNFYYVGTSPGVSTGFLSKSVVHAQKAITPELLSTGLVQVYFTSAPDFNASQWTALPYSFSSYGGYAFNYAVETDTGQITLYFYFTRITADPPDLQAYIMPDLQFRIVLIPGDVIAESTRLLHSGPGPAMN